MEENPRAARIGRSATRRLGAFRFRADEIRDDHRRRYSENLAGSPGKKTAHRRNPVAREDCRLNRRKEIRIGRHIGAMERGHHGRPSRRRNHVPGENSGHGVRVGVVDMDHVETVGNRDMRKRCSKSGDLPQRLRRLRLPTVST